MENIDKDALLKEYNHLTDYLKDKNYELSWAWAEAYGNPYDIHYRNLVNEYREARIRKEDIMIVLGIKEEVEENQPVRDFNIEQDLPF
jgi:hypothetical protein